MNLLILSLMPVFSSTWRSRRAIVLPLLLVLLPAVSGCESGADLAHQRSMAELNQKAQVMMQSGDYAGAVARLESAHDLEPDEPNTTYNLGMAYQAMGRFDQAIGMFTQVLDKSKAGGPDSAEVHKALGITWEAKADKLSSDAKSLSEGKGAGESQRMQALNQEARQAYRAALDNYSQAVESAHLKDAAEVQHQMDALKTRLSKGFHS